MMTSPQAPLVRSLAQAVATEGGKCLVVGGAVRDSLMGIEPKDLDVEMHGVSVDRIEGVLKSVFDCVHRDGKAFPVWRAYNHGMGVDEAIEVALPRSERKIGPRHVDFETSCDPFMGFEAASARRDFTINAMGLDVLSGEVLDFHGGVNDLNAGVIRHVSDRFSEDPLRVLRGMRFAGQFGFQVAPETVELSRHLSPEHIAKERIFAELTKFLLKSKTPSAGLQFLQECGWTQHLPELHALIGVQQDPEWHPEGDAFVHTLHCLDAFAEKRTGITREDMIVGYAVLCHDFGKATHTQFMDGRWRSHGHEAAGEAPTINFLRRLTDDKDLIDDVVALVVRHMIPSQYHKLFEKGQNMDRAIRRLATEVRIDRLAFVSYCDSSGRPPKPKTSKRSDWLLDQAKRLNVFDKRPDPLVQGRDLIAAGYRPGAHFKPVLKEVYDQQLDGKVSSYADALKLALEILAKPQPQISSSPQMS